MRGCSKLDDPANGQVFLTGTSSGSLAVYICNPGFRLEGSRNRVCQVNGQWSAKEPSCIRESISLPMYTCMYVVHTYALLIYFFFFLQKTKM